MRTLPALIIYFLFFQIFSFGQNYERTINWLPNKAENLYDTKFELLNFTNAVYENISTGLPYYYEQFKMLPYNNDGKIEIVSANFEVIPSGQLKSVLNIDSIPTEIVFRSSVSYIKKKPFLQFSFIPLRHNKNAGTVEKLVSFTFKKSENNNQLKNIKSRVYASSSVLNSGKWQKIKINQTGIYKLTYKQISDLGFTNPDKIKIFGNGGKVLSVNNFNYRHDDLVENPIWFEKVLMAFLIQAIISCFTYMVLYIGHITPIKEYLPIRYTLIPMSRITLLLTMEQVRKHYKHCQLRLTRLMLQ